MNVERIWNLIVKHYQTNYNAPEEKLQKDWENKLISGSLGYMEWFGEIDAHRTIHLGSTKRVIPDIIIKNDERDLFDIELKQYSLPFTIEMEQQLKSYMDLLHVSVGVLVCQKIYVYVYDFSKSKLKKVEISFIEDNPDGIAFVELFSKGNFSEEKVEDFIDSKSSIEENVKKIKEELTAENILQLIREHLSSTYTLEEIMFALKDVSIDVKHKSFVANQPITVNKAHNEASIPTDSGSSGMDYSKYMFEGHSYGKNRLVLAVVKAYVRDNPAITTSVLKGVFYDKLQGSTGVIATPYEANKKCKDPQKRFFTKDPIFLKDGEAWVCTQWGIENISGFIKKAVSLGYGIEKM